MRPTLLAFCFAMNLSAPLVHAATSTHTPEDPDSAIQRARNKPSTVKKGAKELEAVDVAASMDYARNALSPGTGSSQYVMDRKTIAQLPLGDSSPMNQVLLQSPGVVQDSYGQLHVRGDHANLQYRINGVMVPEPISKFGQVLDARAIQEVKLIDGALPAQYGLRTAAVVDINTKNGQAMGSSGSVGLTSGSFGMFNPNASLWGRTDRWSWFITANYLESDVGIENPTSRRKPIHDRTYQTKGFGNLSYLIDNDTRLSFVFGVANSRFQLPNRPGQQPKFGYLDTTSFDSSMLNEDQRETTRFGVLALQGKLGVTDYQLSMGQRYSDLAFTPDKVGDLMFTGIASAVNRHNRASTAQMDFATPLGTGHILRYGLYGSFERGTTRNDAWVFPADSDGGQASTAPLAVLDVDHRMAKTWAAYIQDEWNIDDRWTVNYGARVDRYQLTHAESQFSPRLGVVFQATDSTTIHAGYARYFTPPATEMITDRSLSKFAGTTNARRGGSNRAPLAERSHYFDAGISQSFGSSLVLGFDAYYREVKRLQDEGQFGAAVVYSTFNYDVGRIRGVEFTASYDEGPLSAYFNLAYSRAMGKRIITGQYNFESDDLSYIHDHYIHLDHDQALTSSGGVSYALSERTRIGANYLFGSGLRKAGAVPNGGTMPAYFQLNLSASHDFDIGHFGTLHAQLAVINALDRTYQLRDGTGIGVGAPQFGPRRGVYLSLRKDF